LTLAFSVAVVCFTALAASVCAVGAGLKVVNAMSGPSVVPAAFVATMRKW
jgi:hypothetical protein